MAGDWLKVELALPDKPEVFRLADLLGIDPDCIVGKLIRFWAWCDIQSVNGNALGVTRATLDRIAHQPGFAAALENVGWLEASGEGFTIPNFERHNGQTSKARAVTNRRVAKHRAGGNAEGVTDETAAPLPDETAAPLQKPLPEKRREESNISLSPASDPANGSVTAQALHDDELPEWMGQDLKDAFGRFFRHLREIGREVKRTQRQTWFLECQRYGEARALDALAFSLSKGAKSIIWESIDQTRAKEAGRNQPQQPAKPATPSRFANW